MTWCVSIGWCWGVVNEWTIDLNHQQWRRRTSHLSPLRTVMMNGVTFVPSHDVAELATTHGNHGGIGVNPRQPRQAQADIRIQEVQCMRCRPENGGGRWCRRRIWDLKFVTNCDSIWTCIQPWPDVGWVTTCCSTDHSSGWITTMELLEKWCFGGNHAQIWPNFFWGELFGSRWKQKLGAHSADTLNLGTSRICFPSTKWLSTTGKNGRSDCAEFKVLTFDMGTLMIFDVFSKTQETLCSIVTFGDHTVAASQVRTSVRVFSKPKLFWAQRTLGVGLWTS